MRKAEPRYYTARRQWYVMHKGKRHVLVRLGPGETMQKTRARALEAYADLVSRLKAEGVWEVGPGDRISVATMGARYLAAMEASLAPATLRQYGIAVRDVAGPLGDRPADSLRPADVEAIYAGLTLSPNSSAVRIVIIRTWWRWATRAGLIPRDNLTGLRPPRTSPRSRIPTPEECRLLLDAPKPRWVQDVLEAVHGTGCRPIEVFRATAADVSLEDGCWRVHGKTTRRTGKLREIHFGPKVRAILVRLMRANPSGPLFRRPNGKAHLRNGSLDDAVVAVRESLGLGDHVTLGSMRHLFATDALEAGIPPATVAALLGHTNTTQLTRTYGRLIDRKGHLKEALGKIRGG